MGHSSFTWHPSAAKLIATALKKGLASAKKSGAIEVLRHEKTGNLRAALILAHLPPFYSRKPSPSGSILLRGGDRRGERWVRTRLRKHRSYFVTGFSIQLDAKNLALINDLNKLGIHIHSAVLAGNPRRALQSLKKKYGDLTWDNHSELSVEELKTSEQIDAIIRIMKREFTRNPQYGWFVATPDFLNNERKMLNRERRRDIVTHYVILGDRKQVLGHFGFEVKESSPFGKRLAGMALNFDRSIQGKGLAKLAYFLMLKRMVELKIGIFLGGTSQKPVLALSRIMKRSLVSYAMRHGKPYFPKEYFQYA